jgi:hypothetical protein
MWRMRDVEIESSCADDFLNWFLLRQNNLKENYIKMYFSYKITFS